MAALAIEIVSPDDDTWKTVPFYAEHGVDELLIVDLQERRVDWLGLEPNGEHRVIERRGLIELGPYDRPRASTGRRRRRRARSHAR
jgi:Uma2 family endonuclease